VTNLPAGDSRCEAGGLEIQSGVDTDRDGTLDPGEVDQTAYLCLPVPRRRVMFVTSQQFDGNLGGVEGADAKCQAAADAVPSLAGKTFRAWISVAQGSEPASTFTSDGMFVRVDGKVVADSFSDLRDTVLSSTLLDENGDAPPALTWTATDENGMFYGPDCSGWTDSSPGENGIHGDTSLAQWYWSAYDYATCDTPAALYCVEQ
jgi:hypothetical protein